MEGLIFLRQCAWWDSVTEAPMAATPCWAEHHDSKTKNMVTQGEGTVEETSVTVERKESPFTKDSTFRSLLQHQWLLSKGQELLGQNSSNEESDSHDEL